MAGANLWGKGFARALDGADDRKIYPPCAGRDAVSNLDNSMSQFLYINNPVGRTGTALKLVSA